MTEVKITRDELRILKELANNIGESNKIDEYKKLFPNISSKITKTEQKIITSTINGEYGEEKREALLKIIPRKIKFTKSDLFSIEPKTKNQEVFFNTYESKYSDDRTGEENDMNFLLDGVAGTGKTFLAMAMGLDEVISKSTKKRIIIIRSAAETRKLGFLPGTKEEKAEPFESVYEKMTNELLKYKTKNYKNLKSERIIEFMTTSFLRGETFDDAVIIVDEYQNLNFHEMDTVMTRVGLNSRLILCGQEEQSDLIYNRNDTSCASEIKNIIKRMKSFNIIEFKLEDIVRSGFVYDYIKAKESLKNS